MGRMEKKNPRFSRGFLSLSYFPQQQRQVRFIIMEIPRMMMISEIATPAPALPKTPRTESNMTTPNAITMSGQAM